MVSQKATEEIEPKDITALVETLFLFVQFTKWL